MNWVKSSHVSDSLALNPVFKDEQLGLSYDAPNAFWVLLLSQPMKWLTGWHERSVVVLTYSFSFFDEVILKFHQGSHASVYIWPLLCGSRELQSQLHLRSIWGLTPPPMLKRAIFRAYFDPNLDLISWSSSVREDTLPPGHWAGIGGMALDWQSNWWTYQQKSSNQSSLSR